MRRRVCLKVVIASVLVLSSALRAVPQSAQREARQAREKGTETEEGAAARGAASEQGEIGVVRSGNPTTPVLSLQTASSYSRFIDPVNGLTADDFVRYALAHNGELAAARQMIADARCRLRQAGLRPNPIVGSSG